jgi:hypothetical protein
LIVSPINTIGKIACCLCNTHARFFHKVRFSDYRIYSIMSKVDFEGSHPLQEEQVAIRTRSHHRPLKLGWSLRG